MDVVQSTASVKISVSIAVLIEISSYRCIRKRRATQSTLPRTGPYPTARTVSPGSPSADLSGNNRERSAFPNWTARSPASLRPNDFYQEPGPAFPLMCALSKTSLSPPIAASRRAHIFFRRRAEARSLVPSQIWKQQDFGISAANALGKRR